VNSVTWISLNGGPAGKSIEIKLSTERFEDSLAAAQSVKAKLASYRGVFDIDDNSDSGLREVRLKVREAARPTGVTVATLGNEVRNAFFGREARRITRNREDVKIIVRYPEHYRQDIYRVEEMWIPVAGDEGRNWVPLREVAELTEGQSSNAIHRSQQQRSVSIFADVDEAVGDETEIVAAAQSWLDSDFQRQHPGVRAEMLGKTVEINKFMASMKFAFPMSLVIIYVLLAALFRSYVQPLVVMIAVPFGVQGAVIGHWIMGYDLTVMSMIGLVALNGIVDNDSLVLVDFINNRQRAGLSLYEASVEGSKLRLRAILLTTVTVVAGMAPLMAEQSFQAKFLIPLAITLSFGLVFATLLTLIVVPAINMIFFDMKRAWHWLWLGEADLTGEEAEVKREPTAVG
jgi:multidrug efflux pump subunit AcrB